MRLWSIHPRYLDTKGLLAVWREGLLALHVLEGRTRGYTHHPQLNRFKSEPSPQAAIHAYLRAIYEEACARGYRFNPAKLRCATQVPLIGVSRGQLDYEFSHLLEKLKQRDPARYKTLRDQQSVETHPLFYITEGGIADWEIIRTSV